MYQPKRTKAIPFMITYVGPIPSVVFGKILLTLLWMYFLEDFDNDGTSECIGLTVSEITIFQEAENAVNLLTGNFQIPEDFLKKFSRYNFDGFCLGMS